MTTLKVQRRNMETKAKKLRREGYVTGRSLKAQYRCRLKRAKLIVFRESA